MDDRGNGRVKSHSKLRDSRSPPSASVANDMLQTGNRKLMNTPNTIQLENMKKPERSSNAFELSSKASWMANAGGAHGRPLRSP